MFEIVSPASGKISRIPFAVLQVISISLMVVNLFLFFEIVETNGDVVLLNLINVGIGIPNIWIFFGSYIHRLNDTGNSPYWCFLHFIGIMSPFLFLYLLFKKGKEPEYDYVEDRPGQTAPLQTQFRDPFTGRIEPVLTASQKVEPPINYEEVTLSYRDDDRQEPNESKNFSFEKTVFNDDKNSRVNTGIYIIIGYLFMSLMKLVGDYSFGLSEIQRLDLLRTIDLSGSAVSLFQLSLLIKGLTTILFSIFVLKKIKKFRIYASLIILLSSLILTSLYFFISILNPILISNPLKGLAHILISIAICLYIIFSKKVKSAFG